MREMYGFLRLASQLASRLANPFGHPSQVCMQVLVLQTCVDLRRLASPFGQGFIHGGEGGLRFKTDLDLRYTGEGGGRGGWEGLVLSTRGLRLWFKINIASCNNSAIVVGKMSQI